VNTEVVIQCVLIASTIILTIVVAANNPRATKNRMYVGLTTMGTVWLLANALSDNANPTVAFFFAQLITPTSILACMFFLYFSLSFPNSVKIRSRYYYLLGLPSFLIAALSFTALNLSETGTPANEVFHLGPLYPAYLALLIGYSGAGIILLFAKMRHASVIERSQIKFVLFGIIATLVPAITFGAIMPALGNNSLSDYAPYFTISFIVITAFAIIRHGLFDIRMLVARSVAYIFLTITLAIIYGAAIFGASRLFFSTTASNPSQNAFSTAIAVILAFTFQPLRRFFDGLTDRIFYRDRYDSQVAINNFSKILVSELDLNRMLKKSLAQLCENMHIQFGQIIVFNNGRVYRIEHYGPLPNRLMISPELAQLDKPLIVADELEGGERKALMESHGVRISMTLRTREEFVGYLLLGDKLSGDIYSDQDLKLLEIISKEFAVAILNAKAYAEIQEFNLTLQARVDHATNRLRVANRHLKELDRAKDEFISMASHQLRTPLTTIKGYLSMMLEGDAGKITPAQKEFVGYAFGSSERMVNLISDLLNVSRLSAGRFLIQRKPTDMVQMIADEVRQLQTHATAKGLKLIFDKPEAPLPPAEIDDNKTRQVIMNFIDNAIYYTQKGQVRVVLEQTGDLVRLEVRDTGIGVPDDAKKKLFSKFFRAGNAQVVRPDGTGLGLYLAKRVVEDQGGTIIFSSVEGKGSVFGFELPFKPEPVKHEEVHARHK
jgi:signal transduction histidine kinase